MPLYAVSRDHGSRLAGVLFGQIRLGEMRFRGMVDETIVVPGADSVDLAVQVANWEQVLNSLGEQFRAGRAEADPNDPAKACRYCALTVLCRCGERQQIEVEEA